MYVHTCTKLKLISIDDTISKRGSNNLQQYTFTIGPESPTTGYNNMDNIGQAIIDLILKPGSSLKLIPVINVTVLLLLCLMAALAYSKIATIHILIMSTLAVGLLVSVNWFYYEFQKAVKENGQEVIEPNQDVSNRRNDNDRKVD